MRVYEGMLCEVCCHQPLNTRLFMDEENAQITIYKKIEETCPTRGTLSSKEVSITGSNFSQCYEAFIEEWERN